MGTKVGGVERAVAGYVRASLALGSREIPMAGEFRARGQGKQCAEFYWGVQPQIAKRLITVGATLGLGSDWRCRVIGECNCRLLDAL